MKEGMRVFFAINKKYAKQAFQLNEKTIKSWEIQTEKFHSIFIWQSKNKTYKQIYYRKHREYEQTDKKKQQQQHTHRQNHVDNVGEQKPKIRNTLRKSSPFNYIRNTM